MEISYQKYKFLLALNGREAEPYHVNNKYIHISKEHNITPPNTVSEQDICYLIDINVEDAYYYDVQTGRNFTTNLSKTYLLGNSHIRGDIVGYNPDGILIISKSTIVDGEIRGFKSIKFYEDQKNPVG